MVMRCRAWLKNHLDLGHLIDLGGTRDPIRGQAALAPLDLLVAFGR
jgi:hypothetical protein